MSSRRRGPVAPRTALAFSLIGFAALLIASLGITSLLTSSDVIAVPGVGELPGILAVVAALAMFAGVLWVGIRREHPSYWTALWTAVATFLAYLFGAAIGALFSGHGIAASLAVVSALVTRWYGVVVFGTAVVSAWAGVALVRTRSGRPRWPWESDEDE
ncbi:hypothetical protein ABCS02_10915 [Microbacterium sp. X-17]|uniref:hypothetical protein n=1 Tax=Microbacterium sp. X-17 TaxID=3144404 RepID=UPI0031F4B19D